jgi:hypothetical protein
MYMYMYIPWPVLKAGVSSAVPARVRGHGGAPAGGGHAGAAARALHHALPPQGAEERSSSFSFFKEKDLLLEARALHLPLPPQGAEERYRGPWDGVCACR